MKRPPWPKPWILIVEAMWTVILQGPVLEGKKRFSLIDSKHPQVTFMPPSGFSVPLYQGTSWGREGTCDSKM